MPACWRDIFGIRQPSIPGQQFRHHVAGGALDFARVVDGRLAEPFDQVGRERQHGAGLVDIRDQVDDDINALPEGLGVVGIVLEQGKRIGVMVGVLEQIFGRRVAAERRIKRQHAKSAGDLIAGRRIKGWIFAACA